ncbi:hypothetical protein [Actinoplanes regularis]|uniref:hypothetical protein n=1 Tax=Actinoplanes regularis TaxID=52697 RepID=UPI0015C5A01A|nr:hypothetical protein [Actinoplanes regularis]GIE91495.1 hypothetical protein Are01nite_79750 [Actinoplanes regularis]
MARIARRALAAERATREGVRRLLLTEAILLAEGLLLTEGLLRAVLLADALLCTVLRSQLLLDKLLRGLVHELQQAGLDDLLDRLLGDLLDHGLLGEGVHQRMGVRLMLHELRLLDLLDDARLLRQELSNLLPDQLLGDAVRQLLLRDLEHLLLSLFRPEPAGEPLAALLGTVCGAAVTEAGEHLLAHGRHGRCVRHG